MSNYEYYLLRAKSQLAEIKIEIVEFQEKMKALKEGIEESRRDIADTAIMIVNNDNFSELKIIAKTELETILINTLISITESFRSNALKLEESIEKHNKIAKYHNLLVKEQKNLLAKIELIKNHQSSFIQKDTELPLKFLEITANTKDMDKIERKNTTEKLLGFVKENEREIPSYVHEFVEKWVEENP